MAGCISSEQSVLSMLFNNEKIFKLLNIQKSLRYVWFGLYPCINKVISYKADIENLMHLMISKLDHLREFGYTLNVDHSLQSTRNEKVLWFGK